MEEFKTLNEAYQWFLENVYPGLPSETKYELRDAKYAFYKEGKKVSEKRMQRILADYCNFDVVFRVGKKI